MKFYHATTKENARQILMTGMFCGKENEMYLSDTPNGEIRGYGDTVIELNIPLRELIPNDKFGNEMHYTLPLKNYQRDIREFSPNLYTDKIEIKNLDKLKITNVKQWAVNFNYDGQEYFLHDDSVFDEDRCIGLYRKTPQGNDRIAGKITLAYPYDYITTRTGETPKYNRDNRLVTPLSQISKKYFVYKLTQDGLINSLYDNEIRKQAYEAEEVRAEIKEYKDKISVLESELYDINRIPDTLFEKEAFVLQKEKKSPSIERD